MKKILLALFAFSSIVLGSVQGSYAESKRILMVVTSHDKLGDSGKDTGFWLPELTHPYYELKDNGYDVDVVSIRGGMAPVDAKSYNDQDPADERFLNDKELMSSIIRSKSISEVNAKDYVAVVYAGGSGTMWDFPENEHVLNISREIYEKGGVISAICHGPAAFVNLKLSNGEYLVKGKKVTAFTNAEEDAIQQTDILPFLLQDKFIERGAEFVEANVWQENVVVDGRLVTGQNPASAAGVAHEIMKLLEKE